jgi:hypothetical protein
MTFLKQANINATTRPSKKCCGGRTARKCWVGSVVPSVRTSGPSPEAAGLGDSYLLDELVGTGTVGGLRCQPCIGICVALLQRLYFNEFG